MKFSYFLGAALACSLWLGPGFVPAANADDKTSDPVKKDNKDKDTPKKGNKEEDKDAKPESFKASQVRGITNGTGKISAVDEKSFSLEIGQGKAKQTLEILLPEDAKVNVPKEQEFDDKGKPKPFKPGFKKGSRDDLREGQLIRFKYGRLPNKKLAATEIWIYPEKK